MESSGASFGLVFLAGGLGSVMRFLVTRLFPAGTLWTGSWSVNGIGCLLIGIASARVQDPHWRLTLMTGALGGFTTFSAFGLETAELLRQGRWPAAVGYVCGQVVLGVGAVAVGTRI